MGTKVDLEKWRERAKVIVRMRDKERLKFWEIAAAYGVSAQFIHVVYTREKGRVK